MSDTPRTDAAAREGDTTVVVDTDFARQLERELNEMKPFIDWLHTHCVITCESFYSAIKKDIAKMKGQP